MAAGAFAGVARSLFTPAWSYLPAANRAQLAKQQGGSLFLPARTPLFYRYRSGAKVANGVLSVPFTNRVRIRKGLWRWTGQSFVWQVRKLPAGKTCDQWATRTQTFQVDGNKVFGAVTPTGAVAWRCVTDAHGTLCPLRIERRQAPRRWPRDRGRERPRREPPPLARPRLRSLVPESRDAPPASGCR